MTHLDWKHGVATIPEHGLEVEREATPEERAAIAAVCNLLSCERLKVGYRVRRLDRARFAMSAALEMSATQSCVVTLEPIATEYSQTFQIELWPHEELPPAADDIVDAFAEDEPETFENNVIDVGSIVVNRLADLVDPYPRKPRAIFSWTDERALATPEEGPFSKLRSLHPRR